MDSTNIVNTYGVELTDEFKSKFKSLKKNNSSIFILGKPLKKWLSETLANDSIKKVIALDERIEYSGSCETCYYETYMLDIYFKLKDNDAVCIYSYCGSLGDFIQELIK